VWEWDLLGGCGRLRLLGGGNSKLGKVLALLHPDRELLGTGSNFQLPLPSNRVFNAVVV